MRSEFGIELLTRPQEPQMSGEAGEDCHAAAAVVGNRWKQERMLAWVFAAWGLTIHEERKAHIFMALVHILFLAEVQIGCLCTTINGV